MIFTKLLSACIFLLFLFIISCRQGSENAFELKPVPGSSYRFLVSTEESESRETQDRPSTSNQFAFTLHMQKRVDSLQTFNLVIDRIKITRPETTMTPLKDGGLRVSTTGRSETLSTDSVKNDPWHNVMPRLVGDSVKIVMNNSGSVDNAWGYETIKNKIVAATGEDVRNINLVIRDYVSPEAIADLMKTLFFYLPGKPVEPGDQWVKNVELTQKAPVKYSHNITVDSIKGDLVYLSVQTIVSSRLGGGKLILEGELNGKIIARKSSGMLLELELTENAVTHTDSYDVNRKRIIRATAVHQSPSL